MKKTIIAVEYKTVQNVKTSSKTNILDWFDIISFFETPNLINDSDDFPLGVSDLYCPWRRLSFRKTITITQCSKSL